MGKQWKQCQTLESPLDCKQIQPVHSKGDQSWEYFGRNDAKAETPILWLPHAKSWLIGKDSDAGRDWGQEEKGMTEDEMAGCRHQLDGHEFECTQGVSDDQKAWRAVIHGVTKSRTGLSEWTELNWAEHKIIENHIFVFQILFFLILSFCKNEKSANAIVK